MINKGMKIAGIDYSMTCPCVCVFTGVKFNITSCKFHYLTDKKKYIGSFYHDRIIGHENAKHLFEIPMARYEFIADWAMKRIEGVTHVLLEGYSMGSSGMVFNIAENTALLKYKIWRKPIELNTAAPTSLKKLAIKGNASKDEMYGAFFAETNIDLKTELSFSGTKVSSPIGDIVDSYYACKYGFNKIQEEKDERENQS